VSLPSRVAIAVLLLLAGAAAGAYISLQFARSRSTFGEATDIAHLSTYVQVQRASGTDAAYEEALKAFLHHLEQRRGSADAALPESMYAVDSALTYARLADLARKRGASTEAANYMALAEAQCPKMGWRSCSGAQIAEMAAQVDSDNPWGHGASSSSQ
jgi:hypothetical protein